MNLEKFKEKNRKKNWMIGSGIVLVLLLVVVFIYRSYAVYEERQEYDVIEGRVPSYIADYDVKVNIIVDGVGSTKVPDKGTKKISSIVCDKGASGVWDYRNWMIQVRNLTETKTTCQVNFVSEYQEGILNGTDPVIKDGLIPVIIEDNGVVKKADVNQEWYKYADKRWANAVILNDESKTYQNGEVIPENNIESYFVWIPRFKYKIFNDGKYEGLTKVENRAQEIEVVFESNSVIESKGTGVGSWLTHPAFTAFDTNGMWVGKFETGYKGSTDKTSAQKNENAPESVQIKPNVNSWRNIQVVNAYFTSYDYKRDYNSHMMKNTEWGAVAYLQHSKYGSMSSVRFNNNSNYVTGYASVKEPTCGYSADNRDCNQFGNDNSISQAYHTSTGYLASTTGNISGVYDMSGGAFEYVMGVMKCRNGKLCSGTDATDNSGFNGPYSGLGLNESLNNGYDFPSDTRYYDVYDYYGESGSYLYYYRRILGDATGEMGPYGSSVVWLQTRFKNSWYADGAVFINFNYPWFVRSGSYNFGDDCGIFYFDSAKGHANVSYGFRVVLSM